MVNPKKDSLYLDENGNVIDDLKAWYGNFFLLDYDALQGNKPKFKITTAPWLALFARYNSNVQSGVPIWHSTLPQAVSLQSGVVLGGRG